jgi:hypothetical protein
VPLFGKKGNFALTFGVSRGNNGLVRELVGGSPQSAELWMRNAASANGGPLPDGPPPLTTEITVFAPFAQMDSFRWWRRLVRFRP